MSDNLARSRQNTSRIITLDTGAPMVKLTGVGNDNFRQLAQLLGVRIKHSGNKLKVDGPQAERACRVLDTLTSDWKQGKQIDSSDISSAIAREFHTAPTATERGGIRMRHEQVPTSTTFDRQSIAGHKRDIRPRNPRQQQLMQAVDKHELVFAEGPAGTGKTFLAVALAVDALRQGKISRVILVRPAVEAGEKIGYLPGDLQEKFDPYMRPLYDSIFATMGNKQANECLNNGTIEIAPLAFMRGRTFTNAFAILDEAQNTTVEQMRMFLTRLGANSSAIVTGDLQQTDLEPNQESGLSFALRRTRTLPSVTSVTFDDSDIVRSSLVRQLVQALASKPQEK